jgi:hypothetical protein
VTNEEKAILLELEQGLRAACVAGSVSEPIQVWAQPLLVSLDKARELAAATPGLGKAVGGVKNVFTVGPDRRAVLEWALRECERVARLPERVDPATYWKVAAPGVTLTPRELKEKSWCGGFCLWAVRWAGFGFRTRWDFNGKGLGTSIYPTTEPEPGDIAYFDKPNQHYALIEAVSSDMLWLVNGNSTGKGVARSAVQRSKVSACYSIDRMLADPVPGVTPQT